jgi:hypothetical protein
MPIDTDLTTKQWYRYAWIRDQGHTDYVAKHDKCERFFRGDQWNRADKAALTSIRRPALTINKIISTLSNVMGEQIYNRSEIAYRPRGAVNEDSSSILTKVFKQISDQNQLDWKRSDMFADGVIGSRGYLDVRMSFDDNMQGNVVIDNVNPKNVLVDPDADHYDPDTWNEVITTKWLTDDDVALYYSKKDALLLKGKNESAFPYGYDSIDRYRDRFANPETYQHNMYGFEAQQDTGVRRMIRVIERQYKKIDIRKHFYYAKTGDMRVIPPEWDEDRVKMVAKHFGLSVIPKPVKRIRITVTADNVRLHDDWSPYKHFTIVPYFPFFRRGMTIGLCENLTDLQDLLNKATSQELHIVNTTANSGWKIKAGSLTNMSVEELEERGAETGLVMELDGDPDKDAVKIQPNNTPQGLDRLSYKAEEGIKNVAGVPDSAMGMDRADVAGKAIQEKRKASQTNNVKPLDSLTRSDFILARNVLDLVQEFYTEERVMTITKDSITGETETFTVNQMTPEGNVINDLAVGDYEVVVSSVPQRETLEDSEFDQLSSMRKDLGVKIPDSVIVNASRLRNKKEIIDLMEGRKNTPEAKKEAELQARTAEAQTEVVEGEAKVKAADATLRMSKAKELDAKAAAGPEAGATPQLDVAEAHREHDRKDAESSAKIAAIGENTQLQREKAVEDARLKAEKQKQEMEQKRIERMTAKEPTAA